jgi:hypothetical protein
MQKERSALMKTPLVRSAALVALALLLAMLGCASSASQTITSPPTTMLSVTPTDTDPSGAPTPTATHGTGGGSPGGGGSSSGSAPTATPEQPIQGTDFIVTSTSANSVGAETDINAVASNNNPNAILIVTANSNAGGRIAHLDPHPLGVYYHSGKWAIFHEDKANWIPNASYNVRVLAPSDRAFTVQATSANSRDNITTIREGMTDDNLIVLVTPLWRSTGPVVSNNLYDPHPLGVRNTLTNAAGSWSIYHEDGAAWIPGALYNVQVLDPGAKAFRVGGRPLGELDNPACNSNPHALIFITSSTIIVDPHVLGVQYTSANKWAIFHEDGTDIADREYFNVSVT